MLTAKAILVAILLNDPNGPIAYQYPQRDGETCKQAAIAISNYYATEDHGKKFVFTCVDISILGEGV